MPATLSANFFTELTNLGFSGIYSLQFTVIPQDKALAKVKNRLLSINANMVDAQKKAARSGYSAELISSDLKASQKEVVEQLEDLSVNDQRLVELTFTMAHFASSKEELDKQTEIIKSTARKYLVSINSMDFQQEAGLATTLPLCFNQEYCRVRHPDAVQCAGPQYG